MPWVKTQGVLCLMNGDGEHVVQRYRQYVESGKGEKIISPFERAIAGLVLGSEACARKVLDWLRDRGDTTEQPSRLALECHFRGDPDAVEEATRVVFSSTSPKASRNRAPLRAPSLGSDHGVSLHRAGVR